ncbi:MAG: TPM domain-containing protein [Methylobacteriaceae bacterium]|nr:TPM domain-containing protein [Methylobacteriaceae bacterium]MBV9704100.1 TPM domain-containing protein [Methylobacteriaceae bacterium]
MLALPGESAVAALNFPPLSGRVVDAADVIPAATRATLDQKLKDLEDKSGIQLVVATVKSLDGADIETYANELFRTWKLGEKVKNNGVLLLVAPTERKVRIEVGYGLEGTLTDAISKLIIVNAIAPRFKAGDYGGGIERGVEDIVTTLSADSGEWEKRPQLRAEDHSLLQNFITPLILIPIFLFVFFSIRRNLATPGARQLARRGNSTVFIPVSTPWGSSTWGGSSSGSFSSGGDFSGGGGSSGGGGASGSW